MIKGNPGDKIKKISTKVCDILELIVVILVFVGVVIAIISLIPSVGELWHAKGNASGFLEFLENVFLVVIGIEFLKMLCRPNSDNILETLIFLVARHMIIGTNTTPLEDLISTISIVILCFVRRYLKVTREKDKRVMEEEEIRLEELHRKTSHDDELA